jgi:membrane-associated phospholipid phosphatase
MISTLVIKQHVFIDLVVGDCLAILAFILLNKDVKLTRWFKKYFKV